MPSGLVHYVSDSYRPSRYGIDPVADHAPTLCGIDTPGVTTVWKRGQVTCAVCATLFDRSLEEFRSDQRRIRNRR